MDAVIALPAPPAVPEVPQVGAAPAAPAASTASTASTVTTAATVTTATTSRRIAENRERQRELYGAPLAERVRHLVEVLGISQARLARTLGMSPAMLSQLVSGRRIKIGDPVALARFQMIDHRCAGFTAPPPTAAVERLLADVSRARWRWAGVESGAAGPTGRAGTGSAAARGTAGPAAVARTARTARTTGPAEPTRTLCPAEALRRVCAPAELAAAAAVLGTGFPQLAEVLRRAAARR